MPIVLVTGLPKHGKTLRTLAVLKPLAESEGRPVFHNDIPGLAIDGWKAHDPEKWFELPARSYMVIDECQRVFPIRPRTSAVPKHVQELETHGHLGIDLWVITQHPGLIDTNVRHLVDRHFHVVRKFGTSMATVYEFPTGVQADPFKNRRRDGVVRHEWRYPKEVFGWYRSAEVQTTKARLPAKFWAFMTMLVLIPLLIAFAAWRLFFHHDAPKGEQVDQVQSVSRPASSPGFAPGVGRLSDAMSASQYLASMRPRVPGLAFTAPAYDQLTKPVEAPYPSVCAYSPDFPCRCWSQRGFKLEVPKPLCEQLAREPMDPYWLRRGSLGFDRGQAGDSSAASAPGAGQAVVQASAR